MNQHLSEKEAKSRYNRKIEAYWGIGIIMSIFLLTAFFALRDENPSQNIKTFPISSSPSVPTDSIKSLRQVMKYSEYYEIGYSKGYADGEEDTNDGDYMAGYDDSNPYKGEKSADYCLGYNHGYEDAYDEKSEYSDDEEPL